MSLAPPVPATEAFYVTGGTLPTDAPSYVPRQADHDLLHGLTHGEFCYVLNTRQMGKSSLMVRTAQALRAEGATVAVLDLTAVGLNLTPDQWYGGLLASLGEQLHLEDALEDFWDDNAALGPLQRFMTALGRVALPQVPQRLVLFVDEIDAVRSLPFPADEFFAAIRECYNRRRTDPLYEKLTFCLLGVATPADLIRDTKLSPFNIGRRILLTDFTSAEAAPLAQGLPGGQASLNRVLYWTGGHPYMTQRLCRAVAEEGVTTSAGVDGVCERLFLTKQARESDDNLAFVRARLLRSEVDLASLLDLYVQVRSDRKVKDDETNPLCGVLRLSGVAKAPGAWLEVRNRVYDRVFDREWVLAHMPDAELRRQRAAYRLGLMRAAAVAAVVLLLMGALSAWAVTEGAAAKRALRHAQAETHRADISAVQARQAQAQAQEEAADAKSEAVAEKVANERAQVQAKLAAVKTAQAQKASEQAHQQTLLAKQNEQAAVTEKGAETVAARNATKQAQLALAERLAAVTQRAEAVRQKGYAQQTQQIADLRLAAETYESPTGSAGVVQKLLDASRTDASASGREHFEWRYQWSLLHDGTQMHGISVLSAAVTPGDDLVALDDNGVLHRTSIQGGRVFTVSLPDPGTAVSAALSPDGTQVAVARQDGRVEILDAATLKTVASWHTDLVPVSSLEFDGSGELVGVPGGSGDGGFARWNPTTGQVLTQWSSQQSNISNGFGLQAWSPDGRYRVIKNNSVNGAAWLKDMTRAGEAGYAPTALNLGLTISVFAFSADSQTVAIGDSVGTVSLWDAATGRQKRFWPASTGSVSSLRFLQNDSEIAVGGNDGSVSVWATQQNAAQASGADSYLPIASYKGHVHPVTYLNVSQGHWLISGDSGGTLRAWNLDKSDQRLALSPDRVQYDRMTSLAFSSGGKWLAGIEERGLGWAWDAASGKSLPLPVFLRNKETPTSEDDLSAVAFSPDGRMAAVSGTEYEWESPGAKTAGEAASKERFFLRTWTFRTGQLVTRWQSPTYAYAPLFELTFSLGGLAFSPDGRMIAGGFGSNNWFRSDDTGYRVMVWDAATGKTIKTLPGFPNTTNVLAFAPDSDTLAVGSHNGSVYCFDTRTWRETRQLDENDAVSSLAYSPDGRWLATGCDSGVITLTDTQTWRHPRSNIGFPATVFGLCFSPDSHTLASSGTSSIANLWNVDADSFEETRTLHLNANSWALAFSPDGTSLAVGEGGAATLLRAAPAARIADWGRANNGDANVNGPLQQAKMLAWKSPAQVKADTQAFLRQRQTASQAFLKYQRAASQAFLEYQRAASQRLVRDVMLRRVPGYTDAARANLLETGGVKNDSQNGWEIWLLDFWDSNPGPAAATGVMNAGSDGETITANVTRVDGTDWHVELGQQHLPLVSGQRYVLQFRARAKNFVRIWLDTRILATTVTNSGLGASLLLTPQWQAFRLPFTIGPAAGNNALEVRVGQEVNTVQIADAVLVPDKGRVPNVNTVPAGMFPGFSESGIQQNIVQPGRLLQGDQPPTVPLEATGYNAGVIAGGHCDTSSPAAATASIQRDTTTTIDGFYDYYAKGFNPAAPDVGLPTGQVFASYNDPSVHFRLRLPGKNNALLLTDYSAGSSTGTLTLAHPGRFQRVALLMTGLCGDHVVHVRLNFVGGTSYSKDFDVPDNFNNSASNVALSGFDRADVTPDGSNFSVTPGSFAGVNPDNPALFDEQIVLPPDDARQTLTSITLTKDHGYGANPYQNVAVFGISGG